MDSKSLLKNGVSYTTLNKKDFTFIVAILTEKISPVYKICFLVYPIPVIYVRFSCEQCSNEDQITVKPENDTILRRIDILEKLLINGSSYGNRDKVLEETAELRKLLQQIDLKEKSEKTTRQ